MTFDTIVSEVMDRLNLTSDDAQTRIGEYVNRRYRKVTTSLGLLTSRRTILEVEVDPDVDTDLPDVQIEGIEKVVAIRKEAPSGGIKVLRQLTYDQIVNVPTRSITNAWANKLMEAGSVVITLDGYDPEDAFTLLVEAVVSASTLSGTTEPNFPEDFHDVLIEGAMSDELRKMEKPQLAAIAEGNFQQILSDLRMFIAKSAYLNQWQGQDRNDATWWNPWTMRFNL